MINFSQYPEMEPFITKNLTIENPGFQISPFKESIFEDKRQHYINFLKVKTDNFLAHIERGINGYIAEDINSPEKNNYLSKYNKAIDIWNTFTNVSPYYLFLKECPEEDSGYCLGADLVYDFYRTIPEYGSKLKGLQLYEEYFSVMFQELFDVTNELFHKIGTRGQLFGYIENEIIIFCNYLDDIIELVDNGQPTWQSILNIIDNNSLDINTNYQNFLGGVRLGASDARKIIKPVVKYINIFDIANKVINTCWTSVYKDKEIDDTTALFNRVSINFDEDPYIRTVGVASQISEGIHPYIKEDQSNMELMMVKMIKTTFNELDIRNTLITIHQEIIIPTF